MISSSNGVCSNRLQFDTELKCTGLVDSKPEKQRCYVQWEVCTAWVETEQ